MTEEQLQEIRRNNTHRQSMLRDEILPSEYLTAVNEVDALLAHVDAVGGERERMADDLDRAIGDLMVVAGERDRARTVTDEMVERAYAAWHAFKPTKDDASGHGAMGAALTAALGGDREGGRG